MAASQDFSTFLPVNLLVCHWREEKDVRRQLDKHLTDLVHQGFVARCLDWPIPGGPESEGPAVALPDSAQVVLLMVSPGFLAAGGGSDPVVQRAIERHQNAKARVAPILLCPSDWDSTPFGKLPALPRNGLAVSQWSSVEDAFADIAEGIRATIEKLRSGGLATLTSPTSDQPVIADGGQLPQRIGRYRVERLLGQGAFGKVYLAHDDQLDRPVAIKTPHQDRIAQPDDLKAYLDEARIVAQLDHPGLVPVYDFGHTEDGLCYVVSKFIPGNDLRTRIKQSRPSYAESAEIVAAVAGALGHAHEHDVVHRDIKPANILIDVNGKPYVADFGLAMKEQDSGKGAPCAGTPSYMSPEQARGEGHRVDGRSDIFSLGVVLYELLTGRKPFRDERVSDLLEKIAQTEVRPPREIDASIPGELERICLKSTANRVLDRYSTAVDLAGDLRHFLLKIHAPVRAEPSEYEGTFGPADESCSDRTGSTRPHRSSTRISDSSRGAASHPVRVVPKGLRAFDARDADFFLDLLPGPRDRDGLPESIRFWKTRIEETGPDATFPVGLIYGPSGGGKSSFVQAGLLPRLDANVVVPIHLESVPGQTESRLQSVLRRHCPGLPEDAGLPESLAWVRRGKGLPRGKKLLVILDQFEQWIHTTPDEAQAGLLDAIRQSDGGRVQSILVVRTDYWMGANRCMKRLEVYPREGENSAAVDLFDQLHARKVLAEFGRSFGRLPDRLELASSEQQQFLDVSVSELAENGKVVPVRLALFASMVCGRPWTRATLKEIGGMEGVGVTFLEETFVAATASPERRLHERAARGVLRDLLPSKATDLRVCLRSETQLLEASGYANRRDDFQDLLRILDAQLRLITPTEPETVTEEDAVPAPAGASEKHYQLTHDYLVPSVREWLTRRQKETARGRAELRLAERSSLWNAKKEKRQLPSLAEFAGIVCLVPARRWSARQRDMLRRAFVYHGARSFVLLVAVLAACLASWRLKENRSRALEAVSENVLNAEITRVPGLIEQLGPYRPAIDRLLRKAAGHWDPQRRLRARLALLPIDASQVPFLQESLLNADLEQFSVIRDALKSNKQKVAAALWRELDRRDPDYKGKWFRAGSALAMYAPNDANWATARSAVADQLVSVDPLRVKGWAETLRPVQSELIPPLEQIYRDSKRPDWQRSLAAVVLAMYLGDHPDAVVPLLADAASSEQFEPLLLRLRGQGNAALDLLKANLNVPLPENASDEKREAIAKRRVNVAVALLRMGKDDGVWQLLRYTNDPRTRSYLIHRLRPLGVDPQVLVGRLLSAQDPVDVRRALILGLGEFDRQKLEPSARAAILRDVLDWYQHDADPGIHGAAEWLLRKWGLADRMAGLDQGLRHREPQLDRREVPPGLQWYVNRHGHTMVVIPGPVSFLMGSPATETGREGGPDASFEHQHTVQIQRSFAIAAHEVTFKQFLAFRGDSTWPKNQSHGPHVWTKYYVPPDEQQHCPVIDVSWYDAAEYCNWLSQAENIPQDQWCYLANDRGQYRDGVRKAPDMLQRRGYRLPTEAEWEYACRAGTTTSRYYGETDELLAQYAWYQVNSRERSVVAVGRLKPNDFGLFDMYGNVAEWCDDLVKQFDNYDLRNDVGDANVPHGNIVRDVDPRALRGGGFLYVPSMVRSAARDRNEPHWSYYVTGFRVARTGPSSHASAPADGANDRAP